MQRQNEKDFTENIEINPACIRTDTNISLALIRFKLSFDIKTKLSHLKGVCKKVNHAS